MEPLEKPTKNFTILFKMRPAHYKDSDSSAVSLSDTTSAADELSVCHLCHHPVEAATEEQQPQPPQLNAKPTITSTPIAKPLISKPDCSSTPARLFEDSKLPTEDLESSVEFEAEDLDSTTMANTSLCQNCSHRIYGNGCAEDASAMEEKVLHHRDSGISMFPDVLPLDFGSSPPRWNLDVPNEPQLSARLEQMSVCSLDSAFDDAASQLDGSAVFEEQPEMFSVQTQTALEDFVIIPDEVITKLPQDEQLDDNHFPICPHHWEHRMLLYCGLCEVTVCSQCCSNTGKHHKHQPITSILAMTAGHENSHKLKSHLNGLQQQLTDYQATLGNRQKAAECHLEERKRYYMELVQRWYWKNLVSVQAECGKETDKIKSKINQINETFSRMAAVEKQVKDLVCKRSERKRHEEDLAGKIDKIKADVEEIEDGHNRWQQVNFTVGRCLKLETQHLGAMVTSRTHQSVTSLTTIHEEDTSNDIAKVSVPRALLPSRQLYQFDSRLGYPSDYMASGISMTTTGDILVTDTGLHTLQQFSADGRWRRDFMIPPEEQPSKAVQFADRFVAVAGVSGVTLYDFKDGVTSEIQLKGSMERPQGIAVDPTSGDLVVSGRRADLPVIGIFDKDNLVLKDVVFGDTQSCSVEEDHLGILSEDSKELFNAVPWYVAVDQSGSFVISNHDDNTLSMIKAGKSIEIGSKGIHAGRYQSPAGIHVDENNKTLIVADSLNHRVQLVVPDQQMALVLLNQEHDGIECPMDVTVDREGRLFVLQGDGLVKAFQYA